MKSSTASGKNGKFAIVVFTYPYGFCKTFCPVAKKKVSALRLLIGLQERANLLRS